MIRLLLLLGFGLYFGMLVLGEDRGQLRFGLLEAEREAEAAAAAPVAVLVAAPAEAAPAPVAGPVVMSGFAPAAPLIRPQAAPAPEPVVVVAAAEPATPAGRVHRVTGIALNVRGGPSTDFGVIGGLRQGDEVLVVGLEADGWARILVEGDGIEGYVALRFLEDLQN